ncbi:3-deoxy-manno-octulosonate cytidylyltransferase [Gammaproteobacteria bacterium]|nr:3-deoxy-manno-octulosonate cytidylyltransferase [Gammaproteobacteria bacterium]MDC3279283.1 3-deoxy-manno-octulosonate cytidylyltransferase [Gammaproteobacteria bacterium]
MPKVIAIIPSRLQSSRIPQKPLVEIAGLPMIVHVLRRALLSPVLDGVWVATDSEKVKTVVQAAGGKAILTSSKHKNGTERLAEAAENIEAEYVILVNGDEVLLNPNHIKTSYESLLGSDAHASLLVSPFYKSNSPSDFKVALNLKNEVMYISRGDIPSSARNPVHERLKAYHIMTFRRDFLPLYAGLEKAPLESLEDHEHLRILENGFKIIASRVDSTAISVDTPNDLTYARNTMPGDPVFQIYKDLTL